MVRPFQKRKKRKKKKKSSRKNIPDAHTHGFLSKSQPFTSLLFPFPSSPSSIISDLCVYSSFVRFIFASPPSSKYGQSLFFFFWLNALVGHWSLVWIVNFFCWCVWIINLSKSQNVSKSVGFCCLMLNIIYNHAKLFWLWFHSFAKFLCSIFVQ